MFNVQFLPVRLVGLLNPFVAIPAGDDFSESCLATEATLQGSQVIHREDWCQLIEDGVITSVSDALVLSIDILILQSLTEGTNLLRETIVGHHQRKVDARFALTSTPRKHVKNHPTTETDDGSALTISVLHVIDVFGCLDTFLLTPCLDGLPQTWHIQKPCK